MNFKKIRPYLVAIVIFSIASVAYFSPVLKGHKLNQSDITQFRGMVKDINDYRDAENKEPYWTNASFSGMPAYQISAYYPYDFIRSLDKLLRFLPRPADYTFLYFLSFFVLMLALKVHWRLAIFGALSFGFSTYLIIIFGAGHNAKAHAIAYMPLVLAGLIWVFNKRYFLGFLVTAIAMALEVYTNHPQMTYYLGFCVLILGLVEAAQAFKNKQLPVFFKQAVVVIAAVILGIAANAPRLMAMQEYANVSTRSASELTITPDGAKKTKQTTGLDKAYITEYSYAKLETFNLFIPRFMGGGTVEALDEDSNFYKFIAAKAGKKTAKNYAKQVFTYWGDQPIVEAPAYIGAVLFFLFFLGLFLVKGKIKQWLVIATCFSIVLSWGKNLDVITNFFIDYVPLYNKFRAVSSIQVVAELCVPILAVLGLKHYFSSTITTSVKLEALKKAVIYFGGLVIVGFLAAHIFGTFEGLRDAQQYGEIPGFIDAVIADRKAVLLTDTIRTLVLLLISAAVLWAFIKGKLKQLYALLLLVVFVLIDLISVNKNYVNNNDFKAARTIENPFKLTDIDKLILKDTTHFRVANFSTNLMSDGATSYFHNSIGGYHAAKMKRYNELFEYQIAKNNMQVLNMLHTKYVILPDDNGALQVQQNDATNGNAWFVNTLIPAETADAEMLALNTLNTKTEAVISAKADVNKTFIKDTTATIRLQKHTLTELTYASKSNTDQFAVFSEIYYKPGWNAYINGKLTPHYNVNYVLRGLPVPKGDNIITFKFEPKVIKNGAVIALSSYGLLFGFALFWLVLFIKKNK